MKSLIPTCKLMCYNCLDLFCYGPWKDASVQKYGGEIDRE